MLDSVNAANEAELAGYVDSGMWEMEEFLARRERMFLHLAMVLEDIRED